MKELRNENFKVTFKNENEFVVENKFGDKYRCSFDENRKIVSKNKLGLKYAMAARQQLGF